jgi:hypothetical protein
MNPVKPFSSIFFNINSSAFLFLNKQIKMLIIFKMNPNILSIIYFYQPFYQNVLLIILNIVTVVSSKVCFLTPNHLHGKTCKAPPYANSVPLFKRQALLNKGGLFSNLSEFSFFLFLLIIKNNNIILTYIYWELGKGKS